jgi:hypothetical protein
MKNRGKKGVTKIDEELMKMKMNPWVIAIAMIDDEAESEWGWRWSWKFWSWRMKEEKLRSSWRTVVAGQVILKLRFFRWPDYLTFIYIFNSYNFFCCSKNLTSFFVCCLPNGPFAYGFKPKPKLFRVLPIVPNFRNYS